MVQSGTQFSRYDLATGIRALEYNLIQPKMLSISLVWALLGVLKRT